MVRWSVPLSLVSALCAPAAAGPRAAEVAPAHWSYQAVRDLASRGLVHGYRDAKFLEDRTLTRFEMASLVKRLLDNWEKMPPPPPSETRPAADGPDHRRATRGPDEQLPTGRPLPASTRPLPFTEADLATTKRLVSEYSVELAVIGADLQASTERLQALEGRLESLEKTVKDPDGPLQKVIKDVSRIDKVRLSGYVQARYESFQKTREGDPPGLQGPVTDRFTIRRARMSINARPTEKIGMRWQFDGARASLATRDAWIDYFFAGDPKRGYTATIGQFPMPFGFEVVQSSGVREAPERARIFRYFFHTERDRGAKIASATGHRWFYEIGVFNGMIGPGRPAANLDDNNNDKDVVGRVRTSRGSLDLGVSFQLGNSLRTALARGEAPRDDGDPSEENPYEDKRIVLGADFQWRLREGTSLQGEWVWGKTDGTHASGYVFQFAQHFTRKDQFVAKYDWFAAEDRVITPLGAVGTPVGDAPYEGTLGTLALGWIHHLDSSTRTKLFYEIHGRGRDTLDYGPVPWQGNVLRFEVITVF